MSKISCTSISCTLTHCILKVECVGLRVSYLFALACKKQHCATNVEKCVWLVVTRHWSGLAWCIPSASVFVVLPWTKKKNHPRDLRWEEHCSIMWSCLITSDQRRARSSATQFATFALCWSCVIEHDVRWWNSVLLTANLGNGSFFVQGSKSQSECQKNKSIRYYTWI